MKPEILFGPYGTQLIERSDHQNDPHIREPLSLLWHFPTRKAIQEIAGSYAKGGSSIATTPTYGFRQFLNPEFFQQDLNGLTHQGEKTFREALRVAFQLIRSELASFSGSKFFQLLNLGSIYDAFDVDPSQGTPYRIPTRQESKGFHDIQLGNIEGFEPNGVLFEAVNSADEAVGIALAAQHYKFLTIISFILDHSGRLPTGETVSDAICAVRNSGHQEIFFAINCCPPEVLEDGIVSAHSSAKSFGGVQNHLLAIYPNAASRKLHELNGSPEGIYGVEFPVEQAASLRILAERNHIPVFGGCCGFSPQDIAQMSTC